MKNSYKLFGMFWDGKISKQIPMCKMSEAACFRDYKWEYDLFDSKEYVRTIKASELMTMETEKERESLTKIIRHCDRIIVLSDLFFKELNPVLLKFYKKRISQIVIWLQETVRNVQVVKSYFIEEKKADKVKRNQIWFS